MARRKRSSNTARCLKADPWVKWCVPAQGAEGQGLILEYGLDDEMPVCDWPLDGIEFTNAISDAANDIVPDEEPDIKKHPIPELESLRIGYSVSPMSVCGETQAFTMSEMLERIFNTLKILKDVWPHPKAVGRLKDLARKLVGLLSEAKELGRKKIELACAMKHIDAEAQLEKAYANLCMTDLTGDIDTDAERLFIVEKITPERFRAAMRRAFMLDKQATKEINSKPKTIRPQPSTTMTETDLRTLLEKAVDNSAGAKDAAERAAARTLEEFKAKSKGKRTRTTTVDLELYKYWRKFIHGDLDNKDVAVDYDRRTRRSAQEFLETHGNDVFYISTDGKKYTVKERVPSVAAVKKMYTRGNKARSRNKAKNGQAE